MASKKYDLFQLEEERKHWKTVNTDCLTKEIYIIFMQRKQAVDMYIDGYSLSVISNRINCSASSPIKWLEKCRKKDEYGSPYGYCGLLPYKHLEQYKRTKTVTDLVKTFAGAMTKLLHDYPELKEYVDNLYLKKDKTVLEKNITKKIIFEKFLWKCKDLGIREYEYPFNTKNMGERALYIYLNELEQEMSNYSISRQNKDARQKYSSTGLGMPVNYPAQRPFSRVQIDGHKIDCILTVQVENQDGEIQMVPIKRIWLLTLIDVATRTILGYHLTVNEEYNRFDILSCIQNAVVPHEKMHFQIPGLHYPEGEGYHSLAMPELSWALFDSIELDNALSHHAKDSVKQISEYLNAVMNFGPVSTPERRGIIERFFQSLETRGFHRIVSTTGTGISDPRREKCESEAANYCISFQHILELTEVLIAQYNVTPHSSLNNFSPLEVLRQRVERGMVPAYLEQEKQENFTLLSYTVTRTVRGSIETGRRPYVQFEGAEYRSDELSSSYDLYGETINLLINPDDLRTVTAFRNDGSEIGILYVAGKWAYTKHSLAQRRAISQYIRKNNVFVGPLDDPITIYHDYLNKKARKHKAAGNKLAALNMERTKNRKENTPVVDFNETKSKNSGNTHNMLSDQSLDNMIQSDLFRSFYE